MKRSKITPAFLPVSPSGNFINPPPSLLTDVFADRFFLKHLNAKIGEYVYRSLPPKGCKWKRTPVDHLKEAGMLSVSGLVEGYKKIKLHISPLPFSQRTAVEVFIHTAINEMYEEYRSINRME